MYDKGKVIIGLVVFLALLGFPIWYSLAGGESPAPPELGKAVKGTECVLPAIEMREAHMSLLNEWRDRVVRQGERTYISPNGEKHEMSLSNTCLNCHADKTAFCDRCHNYLRVSPYCWDCHIEQPNVQPSGGDNGN